MAAGKTVDGGFVYEFSVDGKVQEAPVPPASFTPATAPNAQLAEYGYPTRPTTGTALTKWTKDFVTTQYRKAPLPSTCETQQRNLPDQGGPTSSTTPVAALTSTTNPSADDATSGNWEGLAGYNANDNWTAVEGDYTQSAASACDNRCGGSDTAESSWSGLGGYNNPALMQDGTSMDGTPATSTYAWYEYLYGCGTSECGPNELTMNEVSVAAGDPISTYTLYEPDEDYAYFQVCSGGECGTREVSLSAAYYDGLYADNIDERPTFGTAPNTYYKPLTNFIENAWDETEAYSATNGWQDLENVPAWAITMENSSSQALAYPTGFYSNGFYGIWDAAE